MKILLVEDDEATAHILAQELTNHNYTVETTTDGQMGLELVQAFHYDLLVLDIILPGLNGINLCRQLRSLGVQIPILLLSAKDTTNERVIGLEAGADDYLVKPYQGSELIARIQALLRRGRSILPHILTWEKLQLDPDASRVTYEGKVLHLTPKEYSILELFLRNPGRIFSRSAIIDHVWPSGEFPQEDAVSTQIKGLRQKLKAAGITTDLVETVYGLGYRLKAPPEEILFHQTETRSHLSQLNRTNQRQAQAKVLAVAQQMWGKFKESLAVRMMVLEQAIAQISTETLDPQIRTSAQAEAHRLIGSLGSFGLPTGSEIARQIENLLGLEYLGKDHAQQLEELVVHLKQVVENQPTTTTLTPNFLIGLGRLLIIDDDLVMTEQIKKEAILWGFQVEVATDPTVARSIILSYQPNVIILDLTFPQTNENGMTLLTELKHKTPNLPVLVLTACNQLSDRVKIARLGGNVFLEKPISPEEIIKTVTQELSRTEKVEAKILIVDDDEQMLVALANLLEPWGFQIRTLADPQQFWQILEAIAPDLLILDIEMPNFSGIELCQVVRSDRCWSDLPILFLSAHNDSQTIHQVFTVGGDDYVQKPIVGPELIARILNRLERTRILHRFAEIDELTGIATRRKFLQDLERLIRLADRQDQPFCFMILDLDHFKRVNDQYGHAAGDRVLYLLGKNLKQFFRSEDLLGRWGGEEFVLGLYGITREEGAKRLTDFLKIWSGQDFTDANREKFQITFSAGVVEYPLDGISWQELYRVADTLLYEAKTMGRNRILISAK